MGISELKEIAEALEKLSNIKDLDIDIQINIKNSRPHNTITSTPWNTGSGNWNDWWKNGKVYCSTNLINEIKV